MKKVAVIGATGFVGTHVVKELAERGYQVEALARDTSKVQQHENVTAKSIDVNNVDELAEALKGNDAVINTFNAGWTNPNLYDDFLNGSVNIEKAVEKAGVKRFITVGGAGSLYIDGKQLVDGPDFPQDIKPGAQAARDYLNKIKENTTLDWTFFSPAIEMHQGTAGVRTGKYRTALENPVFDENGRSVLSVEDVAVVLADELEQNNHIRERFTAAY
ncbi:MULTISPECIES: NAD(P)-dependent oxidoreductase [Chryseobacterium]|uniref:NADH-flavin reductase n=1 Tax=Chryseobacterium camelliae TaxID=1265445 RepID=A0ABU0TD62_9FLAO|nr:MULTISPECIES: NAD(P)H-binding protein [Chryseobacterium]MDT3407195.1 putative NADH-flavin reductase [Pseudacidovorax intermedius]MDQ1095014.1 putative NADH-flavin reductase [Chryseobacterium camelliae]MDQ1098954.1 putative NADH-flavin reductase [Chryseobacterium sp. SORGH_AS_1048]MDR6086302.1 putative NADH-flavin reductase [Chryseobacterium sp. SORGH_AS_0909]MDR6130674.1 putative NADH-flavin reductase [Chryseobacterium sp. SORGH_AS_1175]